MDVKFVREIFALIEELEATTEYTLIKNNAAGKTAYLQRRRGKYTLDFTPPKGLGWELGQRIAFTLKSQKNELAVTDAYINSRGLDTSDLNACTHHANVEEFTSSTMSIMEKYYCRKVLPLIVEVNFFNVFSLDIYADESIRYRGLVKANIDGSSFDAYIIKQNDRQFLFIDSLTKYTLEEFHELTWAFIISLGYFVGSLPQDDEYCFLYSEGICKNFVAYAYRKRRKSLATLYHPLNANPHSWVQEDAHIPQYKNEIREISYKELSTLCNLVYRHDEIKAILLLVIETMQSSMLVMPAGLSVALESLTEYHYQSNKGKLNPISNKGTAEQLEIELMAALKKYEENEHVPGYKILEAKIKMGELNKPPNGDKLKAPFIVLDIKLFPDDEEALLYRNDFLHGNLSLKGKKKKGKKSYKMSEYEISMRFYTLINCIILKMIGYEGYVLNFPKIQEEGVGRAIDEPYYRLI